VSVLHNRRITSFNAPLGGQGDEHGNYRDFNSAVYTPATLAKRLGVKVSSVKWRVQNGDIPARKMGRRTVILASDLHYHSTWRKRLPEDGDEPFIEVQPTPPALPPEEPASDYSAWLNEVLNGRGTGKRYRSGYP
jgi:hypothetical protein